MKKSQQRDVAGEMVNAEGREKGEKSKSWIREIGMWELKKKERNRNRKNKEKKKKKKRRIETTGRDEIGLQGESKSVFIEIWMSKSVLIKIDDRKGTTTTTTTTNNNSIDELTSMADQQLVISPNCSAAASTPTPAPAPASATLFDVDQLCKEISFLTTSNQILAGDMSRQIGIPTAIVMDRTFRAAGERNGPHRPGLVQQLLMQIKIRDEAFLTLALESARRPNLLPVPSLLLRLLESQTDLIDSQRLLDRLRLIADRTSSSMVISNGPNGNAALGYNVRNQPREGGNLNLNLSSHSRYQDQVLEEKLRGKVVRFAKDPRCSEVLKRMIKEGVSSRVIEVIFAELNDPDQLVHVSMDSNGKYIVGELLGVLDGEKFCHFFRLILGVLKNLCCNSNGSYVAHKLVDCVSEPNQVALIFVALNPPLIQLMQNAYATKVIALCLEKFPRESNRFFMERVLGNCEALAKDKHGCRMLQKCLECADQSRMPKLMNEIIKKAPYLSRDQYGNYVVQRAVDLNILNVPDWVAERLKGDFVSLSMHQCGSNVVEKVLKRASEEKWPDIFDAVARVVEKNYLALDSHMYGKRIVTCLTKMEKERRSYRLAAGLSELSNF
ncbi:hypothetical protein Sjap_022704 [Stephania japonica]|uniref:PUM-HD domain-containing protein n=1 Tax=Stephania japonica TaxID=461633 RepID=A0AAP0ESG8_9MAGN